MCIHVLRYEKLQTIVNHLLDVFTVFSKKNDIYFQHKNVCEIQLSQISYDGQERVTNLPRNFYESDNQIC